MLDGRNEDGYKTEMPFAEKRIGQVVVLSGERSGRYPYGNSLLVEGSEERVIIDPSLSVVARRKSLPPVDRVINSHCHEDHIAGNHLFPEAPWHFHELDIFGIQSVDNLMTIYGYSGESAAHFRRVVIEEFHYAPRPDAIPFRDGDVFDLGGARVRVLHAPGHTRGHSCFYIEPDDVLYLGDIDLSSFGPYYGDAWSSLEDFERTLERVRAIEARWYATFHHIGVVEGREAFLERFDRFAAVIQDRERRLLEFLREPRTLADVVAHRFVFRPQDKIPYAEPIEQRSMSRHIDRLLLRGEVREVEPGRYVTAGS